MQPPLLQDEPPGVGDERWDALLAALAEHLAAQHDLAPPRWAQLRVLQRPWFPAELQVQRADALVHALAAFRKHCVYPFCVKYSGESVNRRLAALGSGQP